MKRLNIRSPRKYAKQSFGWFGSSLGSRAGSKLGRRLGSSFGRKMANKHLPGLTLKLGGFLFPGLPVDTILPGILPFFKKKRNRKRKSVFAINTKSR